VFLIVVLLSAAGQTAAGDELSEAKATGRAGEMTTLVGVGAQLVGVGLVGAAFPP